MPKKYKIQLFILYYSFATIMGISLGLSYRFYPQNILLIGILLFVVFGAAVIVIQRNIVSKSKIDTME